MNKLFSKIAALTLGLGLAVGVGVAAGRGVQKAEALETADFTLSSASSKTVKDITASFGRGTGSNNPAWYSEGLRLYGSNIVTISTTNDYLISEITFNWEKQGNKVFATATANVGTYEHPESTGDGTWTGSAGSVVFTLGSTGQLQLNTFSVKYSEKEKTNITSFTSIELNSYSEALNTKKQVRATVAVAPEDADEDIVWSSSSESVATIAASDTYGVANITLVGEGTCTFIAAAKHDENIKITSQTFTVTEAVEINSYETGFVAGPSDGTTKLSVEGLNDIITGSDFTAIETDNAFQAGEPALKLSSSKKAGTATFTLPDNPAISRVILRVRSNVDSEGTPESGLLKVTIDSTAVEKTVAEKSYTCFVYDFETPKSGAITIDGTSGVRHYISNIIVLKNTTSAEAAAYGFAVAFNNATADSCSARKVTTDDWATASEAWSTLSAEAKAIFAKTEAKENGNLIEEMLARYEVIIQNYAYSNFMERSLTSASSIGQYLTAQPGPIILIIMGTAVMLSFGIVALLKTRKKEK